ncbi:hypothetical protein PMEL_200580 [Prevotella melaninogenica]|uniref:Uncharacterized protein n=1 Tax=Prevotella melaninogenica TaxID=28132 RepID=A0A250KKA1_9BACT|nr:hypothetical protein PMEL_200580 [Prevotella melaninogenica]
MNSLAATLTPMVAGSMIGEITKSTSLEVVSPLLLIALVSLQHHSLSFGLHRLTEPETEKADVVGGIKGALGYRQLLLGLSLQSSST